MTKLQKRIKIQQKRYHNSLYINFKKEAKKTKLTKDELEAKLDSLIANGYKIIKHTTKRACMGPKTYSFTYNDRIFKLTIYDGEKYYWFTTDYHDDTKNKDTGSPFGTFRTKFFERTGKTLKIAFGSTAQNFKICSPQPLYYQNSTWIKEKWIKNISKEDFSSHYPANAIGSLPDAKTAKCFIGTIQPTEEYPFAFYVKSGHVAIYNEFDSHNYIKEIEIFSAKTNKERTFKTLYNINIENDFTILMKAADENLAAEMNYYYNIKNNSEHDSDEYKEAKLFILKFIGMMEQCNPIIYNSYPYAHLAAVIKWRANIKMFNTLKEIGYNNIIQLCVDGIIHSGKAIGTTKKELGNLITELSNAKFIQRGINQYIIKNDIKEERRFAGFDLNTYSDNIKEWKASSKIKFLKYIKENYEVEELNYGEEEETENE